MTDTPGIVHNSQSPSVNTTKSSDRNVAEDNNAVTTENTSVKTLQNSTEPSKQVTTDTGQKNSSDAFGNNVTVPPDTTNKTNATETVDSQIKDKDNGTSTSLQPDVDITKEPLNETKTTTESGDNSTVSLVITNEGLNTSITTDKSQQQSFSEYQMSRVTRKLVF